jgi:hypothetical protein
MTIELSASVVLGWIFFLGTLERLRILKVYTNLAIVMKMQVREMG